MHKMSENIPLPQSSSASSVHHRKSKRKYDKSKLPTPPPDPTESATEPPETRAQTADTEKEKDELLEYLEHLQKSTPGLSRSSSIFAPALIAEDAFLHLEKLYKLMEQLLELREQNAKLHRRVRDLEHISNLEKINNQIDLAALANIQVGCPSLDRDTALAESFLESILAESKKDTTVKPKPSAPARLRHSILRRNRSGSGTEKNLDIEQSSSRRTSTCTEDRNKPSKVSKWTKVKAAFKWEKASVADAKSQDSGLSGMVPVNPVNLEVARYLRVPSTSEDTGHSPADSGAAGISTPGTLSTASSAEDFHRSDLRSPCEDFRSSEDEYSQNYIPHSKDEQSTSQKSSIKSHRTPWAKMKDIIHTRNSFKKKNRLSTHSDDIQIDIELCSDNEEVFEDDVRTIQVPQTNYQVENRVRKSEGEIPAEIVERYRKAVADDDTNHDDFDSSNSSKWTRVKKAFLTNENRKVSESKSDDEIKNVQAEINRNYKDLQKKLSLEFQEKLGEWERMKQHSPGTSNPSSICGFSDEARDPAFIKKMEEWQRIKGQPPRQRPNINISGEENLAPEFKRRLEEWNKIQKSTERPSTSSQQKRKLGELPRWKSVSGPRTDNSPSFEYPPISDEFKKKLEEWRQIKASGGPASIEENEHKKSKENKSPKLARKNSSTKQKKSQKESHELQWFEKELNKIEKEKQRLERERRKFLERDERLSKLRNSVIGDKKKEVLIHTPSGFYRFEGISKKFAEKLYEWEKAQGIAPEASTFALLSSQYSAESKATSKHNSPGNTPPLVRSKSADSLAVSNSSLCPLTNAQLSSLSLNDMDELEKQCMEDLNSSSLQYLANSRETMDQDHDETMDQDHDEPMDQDEPEALIVEVEDIVEETACPLRTFMDKQQQPIYQREEIKAICEGETCAAPKVRRSESARAQANYSMIEEIAGLLAKLSDNENEIEKYDSTSENVIQETLRSLYETQVSLSAHLSEKLNHLQEANKTVMNTARENSSHYTSHMEDILDQMQDSSVEISQMVEKLNSTIHNRNVGSIYEDSQTCTASTHNIIEELRDKLFQLRRNLSYFCAASDLTAPGKRRGSRSKKAVNKTISNDSRESKTETDISRGSSDKSSATGRLYTKATTNNTSSQGAIKKRIKYRQKNLQTRISPDTDEEEEMNCDPKKKHRKLTRTKSLSDNSNSFDKPDDKNDETMKNDKELKIDEDLMKKVVIPTQTASFLNLRTSSCSQDESSDTPVTVFVKTTRKLFTPIIESQLIHKTTLASKDISEKNIQEAKNTNFIPKQEVPKEELEENELKEFPEEEFSLKEKTSPANLEYLPPLPTSSPTSQKRTKEISPSIRLMMVKYNQKLNEKEAIAQKSGGSSGSASPVAWRSPVSERRVRTQTEKFQVEIERNSPKLNGRKEVKKSASSSHLQNQQSCIRKPDSNIRIHKDDGKTYDVAKSSSIAMITSKNLEAKDIPNTSSRSATDRKHPDLRVLIKRETTPTCQSLELRKRKLQKAKEEFFQSSPLSAPPQLESEAIKFPTRNRLSQISVESGSSMDSSCAGILMKSASAGMINIEPEVYRQIDPELHGGGYVSLPRNPKQSKQGFLGGKFALSNITSKFRKVRMRKGKERESSRMNAVSALCRQSLVVDINKNDSENESNTESRRVSSEDPSPSTSRSGSWIKKPKFFKK